MYPNEEAVDIMLDTQERAERDAIVGEALELLCPYVTESEACRGRALTQGEIDKRRRCNPACALFIPSAYIPAFGTVAGCARKLHALAAIDQSQRDGVRGV